MSKYWKIPPDADAAFAAAMEDVLAVYQMPEDPNIPLLCMDETSKQLIGEVQAPIGMAPGHGQILDHEYVRNGVTSLFVEIGPLNGKRHVEVSAQRTRKDFAHFIKAMVDERYPQAIKVRLVLDNLNTHNIASLYEAFAPAEARRLAEKLELHYTPKHGSWLNIAEIELSVLNSQCLNRRIATVEQMRREIAAWEAERNKRRAPVNWRFTTDDARIKLAHIYPKL